MNVVFIEAVQNFGGARRSTVELAKRLNEIHSVEFVDLFGSCTEFLDAVKKNNLPITIVENKHKAVLVNQGSTSTFKKIANILKYLPTHLRLSKKINQILKSKNTELVITNNFKTLSLLKRNNGYKIIYFARGWCLPEELSSFRAAVIRKKADLLLTNSEAARHVLIARKIALKDKVFVVPNSIESNSLDFDNRYRKGIMVCGGFLKSKGHHIALEALRELHSVNIRINLSLVGPIYVGKASQEYFESLNRKVIEYGLSEYVEFAINVNNVKERMLKTKYLFHPSETEGMPRVIMEAMSYGTIVIANSVGGVNDLIISNYNGFITDHNDVSSYSNQVLYGEENENHLNKIRKNAFESINMGFTKKNQINKFLSAIERLN